MKALSRRDLLAYSAWLGGATLASSLGPSSDALAAQNVAADSMPSSAFITLNEAYGPIASVLSVQAAAVSQLQLSIGWALTKPVADWIAAAVSPKPAAVKRGRVVFLSNPNTLQFTEYDWQEGAATQLQFPPCDGSSTNRLSPTLTLQTRTLAVKPGAATPQGWGARVPLWRQSNFRVLSNVGSIDFARTIKVSAVTLAPGVAGGTVSMIVGFGTEPAHIGLVNSLINAVTHGGQLLADQPTQITVQYLGLDLKSIMATVELRGCRLVAVDPTAPVGQAPYGRTTLTFTFATAAFGMGVLA